MKNQNQAWLNYMGRVIYNYWKFEKQFTSKEPNGDTLFLIGGEVTEFFVNKKVNLFRESENTLYGEVKRSLMYKVQDIADAITLKRLIDRSIVSEINIIGEENICDSTYTNCFVFPKFTSNIEDHYFSKNGYHNTHIGSLSSYVHIDFTCFNLITNNQIQFILTNGIKGNQIIIDNEISIKMSQMISLFLCETSRNPECIFTIPMCLELAEVICNLLSSKKFKDCKAILKDIHYHSESYQKIFKKKNKLTQDIQAIKKQKNDAKDKQSELLKITNEMNIEEITELFPKSKIFKDVILNLFPMSINKSVQGSRRISNILNKKLKSCAKYANIYHLFDSKWGSGSDGRKLLTVEKTLIKMYRKHVLKQVIDKQLTQKQCFDIYNELAKNWFNISFEESDQDLKQHVECVELIDEALLEV